jgi:DNA-binding HxlR family transcriptional regulator
MKETAYVEVLLHPSERLLAVRKTTQRHPNAIPWQALLLRARELTRILYELMGWQKDWQYKVKANCFSKKGEQVIIVDLTRCEFRFRENQKLTKAIPSDWISEFGENLPERMMLCRRALATKLEHWKLLETPSPVVGFELGFNPLTREQAEQRITEMRVAHEKDE